MSGKGNIDWAHIDGASKSRRRLHLVTNSNGLFTCPVDHCEHSSFATQRGCRKHVKKHHGWYYYFDKPPEISKEIKDLKAEQESLNKKKVDTVNFPTLARDCVFAEQFLTWITSNAGGERTKTHGEQIVSRTLKFLKFCQDELSEDDLQGNSVDYYLGSVENIRRFLELLEKEHPAPVN